MSQHRGNTVLFGIWYSTNSGYQALFQIGLISVPDFCLAFKIKIEKMRSKTWAYITNFVSQAVISHVIPYQILPTFHISRLLL